MVYCLKGLKILGGMSGFGLINTSISPVSLFVHLETKIFKDLFKNKEE